MNSLNRIAVSVSSMVPGVLALVMALALWATVLLEVVAPLAPQVPGAPALIASAQSTQGMSALG